MITIHEIKNKIKDKLPYYFSPDTLYGFGQRMDMFKVIASPKGKIFIYAPSFWDTSGEYTFMTYTFREFSGDDLIAPENYEDVFYNQNESLKSILKYIENN